VQEERLKARSTADEPILVDGFLAGRAPELATVQSWVAAVVDRGNWGFEDREGVRQEILLKLLALLRQGSFGRRSSFKTWVYSVAKHSCIDAYRRERTRGRMEVDETGAPPPAAPDPSPEASAVAQERRDMARFILQQLPDECLELWDFVYRQGLSSQEVGSRLGINAGAVRVRVHRCLERARAIRSRYAVLELPMARAARESCDE
jgi:RNA polymerase sigma-70 factor (ECF subfamily)